MKDISKWLEPRLSLALVITFFAIIGIIALAITILLVSTGDQKLESATMVFNAVLPLFATWVGTILAYYYARENLQAATDSTVRLASVGAPEFLRSVSAVVAMIPKDRMIFEDKPTEAKLIQCAKRLGDAGVRFLPVLSPDGKPLALTDRERIFDFIYSDHSGQPDLEDLKPEDLTLEHLLKSGKYSRPFASVAKSASLADAKEAIEKTRECRFAFITDKGTKEEPVIGMLTSTDIMKFAEV